MKLIEEFEKSGSSFEDFAAKLGVKPSTLQFWFFKLLKQASRAFRFLPVDVVASAAPKRGRRQAASGKRQAASGKRQAASGKLYSLVQSCEVNGIDPQSYLADVLVRVKRHPQMRIDELLPHQWRPSPPNTS